MHFSLSYSGHDGDLTASLACNGTVIGTTSGLADRRAAHKWAQRIARDHKVENTPEATETHFVSVTGSKTFSL